MITLLRGDTDKTTMVTTQCDLCGHENYPFTVETEGLSDWWLNGKFIQDALPNLSTSQREKLMSGMCDECSKLLKESEED